MAKIMINGTDFSTPLVKNEAERISYGDSNIKVSLDELNNMIRVATYNATFDSSNGLYRLNLNKSNVLVISAKMIGNAVQVDLYENTSGDYFVLCPSLKGQSGTVEIIYTLIYQVVN